MIGSTSTVCSCINRSQTFADALSSEGNTIGAYQSISCTGRMLSQGVNALLKNDLVNPFDNVSLPQS